MITLQMNRIGPFREPDGSKTIFCDHSLLFAAGANRKFKEIFYGRYLKRAIHHISHLSIQAYLKCFFTQDAERRELYTQRVIVVIEHPIDPDARVPVLDILHIQEKLPSTEVLVFRMEPNTKHWLGTQILSKHVMQFDPLKASRVRVWWHSSSLKTCIGPGWLPKSTPSVICSRNPTTKRQTRSLTSAQKRSPSSGRC